MAKGSIWNVDEGHGAYGEAERRVREACLEGKLSNRRYRRWVNERLLRELAPPIDSIEIGGLFAPPPWGERNYQTPLEQLTEVGNVEAAMLWEPFSNNVDMDYQAKVLSELEKVRCQFVSRDPALNAWKTVDHNARSALKRNSDSRFLEIVEAKVLEFLSEGKDNEIVLEAAAPDHRLLLHGLSQFHGLVSHSVPPARVHISKSKKCKESAASEGETLSLRQFLHNARNPHSTLVV